jgi:hypothetical protein
MVAPWQALAAQVDTAVDDQWGEPVVLRPWTKEEYQDGGPDRSRPVVHGRAVYYGGLARATGPGYVGRGGGGSNLSLGERAVEADVYMTIRQEKIDACELIKLDRVEFPERGETYEVNIISPSATKRPRVSLLRILE